MQWVVYRFSGKTWRAVAFHCERGPLLRTLREKVADTYGTYEGIFPEVVAEIEGWKLETIEIKIPGRPLITIRGHFKEWNKKYKDKT